MKINRNGILVFTIAIAAVLAGCKNDNQKKEFKYFRNKQYKQRK
jgi:hypothetical protein